MITNHRGPFAIFLRTAASLSGCAAIVCVFAGCGGPQVDKYSVTDADREAAKAAAKAGTTALPRDPHDGAAYGPDGKPMGGGGAKAP
jgi:hypothetical protein